MGKQFQPARRQREYFFQPGETINTVRVLAGITDAELAEQIGVHVRTMNRVRHGQCSLPLLEAVLWKLGYRLVAEKV